MDWTELLTELNLADIEIMATLIKPVRQGEWFLEGEVMGFKPGLVGGGRFNYEKDKEGGVSVPRSYDSRRRRRLKPPRVLVRYNVFLFGKACYTDWVDVSNCTFTIKNKSHV